MKRYLFSAPRTDQIEARMLTRHNSQEELRKYLALHQEEEGAVIVAEDDDEAVAEALRQYEDMYLFPNTLYV
jgi:hypothetical protein